MKIVEFSMRRPVTVIICTVALIVFGLYGLSQIGIERMPNVDIPVVMVRTTLEGASPAIIDNDVTDVLESRINTIEGIKNISSSSYEGRSFIVVEFVLERDIDNAAADVRGKASMAQSRLPDDAESPQIDKYNMDDRPIIFIAVRNDGTCDKKTLSRYVDKIALERLQTVQGVGGAESSGFQDRQIRVWVDPEKLESRNLTALEVKAAIKNKHVELPAGRIETGSQEYGIRLAGEYESVEELASLPIRNANGAVIRLRDIARIEDGFEDLRNVAILDGVETILIQIRKQRGANEVEISRGIKERLKELNATAPDGIQLEIVQDNSIYIENSMNGVKDDIIMGIVMTSIVMFLFLRTLRATLVTVITIPVCLLGSIIVLWGAGFTINNMSAMGISLAVGMVVDATTVVIENVQRHREMGKSAARAALDGTSEVGASVIAGAGTTIAVFLPVALMPGMIGRFFNSFGVTVTVTIAISLLLSVTLTPFLCANLMGHMKKPSRLQNVMEKPLIWLESAYSTGLSWVVRHRFLTVAVATGAFVLGILIAGKLGSEFFPNEDQGRFNISVEMPANSSIESTLAFMQELTEMVEKDPRVKYTYGNAGGGAGSAVYKGTLRVHLIDKHLRPPSSVIMREWREKLSVYKDVDLKLGNWGGSDLTLVIHGPTTEELAALGDVIKEDLQREDRGLTDIVTDLQMNKPRVNLQLNRALADDLGVSVRDLSSELEAWFGGTNAGTFNDGGYRYDIRIRADESSRNNPDNVLGTLIRTSSGELIRADGLVEPIIDMAPNVIKRHNRQRSIQIQANVEGISPGEGIQIMEDVFKRHAPQNGLFSMTPAGDSENMKESFGYIITGIVFAVALVYMVMAIQFESFMHPFTVMFSLPLMTCGAFGFLYLMGLRLSVMSLMGIILLIGIVVNNAIMLVDFINQQRQLGVDKVTAVLHAGPMRLRAILMTTVSTMIGTLPIALGLSLGGEVRQPMSAAVIGGLFTSTLLTLFVIPVVYLLMDDLADRVKVRTRRIHAWFRNRTLRKTVARHS
ncbi:MAG: efflux RND transporter permease subunit [Pyramidobacter sp.]|nr:efflux RND transporter permease subunit [Pyramidobacter sp.]